MSAPETTPRPAIPMTEVSQGFWDAAKEGRLAIQRCTSCGVLRHYPQLRCIFQHDDLRPHHLGNENRL